MSTFKDCETTITEHFDSYNTLHRLYGWFLRNSSVPWLIKPSSLGATESGVEVEYWNMNIHLFYAQEYEYRGRRSKGI